MNEIDVVVLTLTDKRPVLANSMLGSERSKSRAVSAVGLRIAQIDARIRQSEHLDTHDRRKKVLTVGRIDSDDSVSSVSCSKHDEIRPSIGLSSKKCAHNALLAPSSARRRLER